MGEEFTPFEFPVTVVEADRRRLRAALGPVRCAGILGRTTYGLRVADGALWLRWQLPLEAMPGPWQPVDRVLAGPDAFYLFTGAGVVHILPGRDLGPRIRHLVAPRSIPPGPAAAPARWYGWARALGANLVTGAALALTFSTWGRVPRVSPGQLIALLAVGLIVLAFPEYWLVPVPRQFWAPSLALEAARWLAVGLGAYLLVSRLGAGAPARPGSGNLEALLVLAGASALVPIGLARGYWAWQAGQGEGPSQVLFALWVGWLCLILLRALALTVGLAPSRRLAVGLMTAGFLAAVAELVPVWPIYVHYAEPEPEPESGAGPPERAGPAIDPEQTFYAQPALLDHALATLAPQRPGLTDLYFVGFAPYAPEAVFMREVRHFQQFVDARFGTTGRSVVLINHPQVAERVPMANRLNLRRVLHGVAKVIDPAEDIVFLYLTSHGTQHGELAVEFPGLPLQDLTARDLGRMVEDSGIRWRVVGISACYSGSFIPELEHPRTLLMTASREDRASFGCSNDREFTYFGEALRGALAQSRSFVDAFPLAERAVTARERAEEKTPSLPQIRIGHEIRAKLREFERQLSSG